MNRQLQDQFDMGRIPLKPLPYINKDNAQQGELMIDFVGIDGNKPSYHIFIVDQGDPTKIYDLTAKIITENVSGYINIDIEGRETPISLHEVINLFYKNFIQKDNPLGFNKEKDISKVLSLDTKRILFKDADGNITLPVTSADAVFDDQGRSLQDRLRNISRVGFANDYIKIANACLNIIEITYPFMNYRETGNYIELRIGTTIIDKSRYQIIDNKDEDGNSYSGTITFFNEHFQKGRRIDILYIYNAQDINNNVVAIDGGQIIPGTLNSTKLEKVSDRFTLPDSTSIATSKALYDMYLNLTDLFDKAHARAIFVKDDYENSNDIITVDLQHDAILVDERYFLLHVLLACKKDPESTLRLLYLDRDNHLINKDLSINIPGGAGKNRLLKFLVNENEAICLSNSELKLESHRYIYSCMNQEDTISFHGLEYTKDCVLRVYRNGVKLFQDLDYRLDMEAESIFLYTKTEARERIIFEAEYIVG